MSGSPAPHVWWSPLNCCFISVGERKPTQSAVITLEILDVTMEAFVSLLNGLPGHSFGLLIALNQYLSFSILLASPSDVGGRGGGFLARRIKTLAVTNYF